LIIFKKDYSLLCFGDNMDKYKDSLVGITDKFIVLKDISCVDSDGDEFERYDLLPVSKKLECDKDGRFVTVDLREASKEGYNIPSLALTCNIMLALYENLDKDESIAEILQQYVDHPHITRTSYCNNVAVHNPIIADRVGSELKRDPRRFAFGYSLGACDGDFGKLLEDGHNKKWRTEALRNFTGVSDLSRLVELSDYLELPIRIHNGMFSEGKAGMVTVGGSDSALEFWVGLPSFVYDEFVRGFVRKVNGM
jgi:hypothetical protein